MTKCAPIAEVMVGWRSGVEMAPNGGLGFSTHTQSLSYDAWFLRY